MRHHPLAPRPAPTLRTNLDPPPPSHASRFAGLGPRLPASSISSSPKPPGKPTHVNVAPLTCHMPLSSYLSSSLRLPPLNPLADQPVAPPPPHHTHAPPRSIHLHPFFLTPPLLPLSRPIALPTSCRATHSKRSLFVLTLCLLPPLPHFTPLLSSMRPPLCHLSTSLLGPPTVHSLSPPPIKRFHLPSSPLPLNPTPSQTPIPSRTLGCPPRLEIPTPHSNPSPTYSAPLFSLFFPSPPPTLPLYSPCLSLCLSLLGFSPPHHSSQWLCFHLFPLLPMPLFAPLLPLFSLPRGTPSFQLLPEAPEPQNPHKNYFFSPTHKETPPLLLLPEASEPAPLTPQPSLRRPPLLLFGPPWIG
ncbi:hypothetical protein AMTRI_Chr01g130660 [Amborella trichopoda]